MKDKWSDCNEGQVQNEAKVWGPNAGTLSRPTSFQPLAELVMRDHPRYPKGVFCGYNIRISITCLVGHGPPSATVLFGELFFLHLTHLLDAVSEWIKE